MDWEIPPYRWYFIAHQADQVEQIFCYRLIKCEVLVLTKTLPTQTPSIREKSAKCKTFSSNFHLEKFKNDKESDIL